MKYNIDETKSDETYKNGGQIVHGSKLVRKTGLGPYGGGNFILGPYGQKSPVCLPCLKTCHLENICFDDQSARRLFQSCSSLELLDLTECRVGQGVTLLDISSETLKHLGICRPGNDYKILLNVPNLLKFEYGYNYTQIEFLGLESLKSSVDARIFSGRKPIFYYTQGSVVLELIRAICHVQKLYLDGETTEAFLRTDQELPKFNNLTSLAFGPISSHASRLLPSLLDNSPQLESLSFDQGGEKYGIEVQDMYMLPEHVPACVAQHLKEVEFRSPFGLDFDMKLIKYFLKYAKNLRRMKICSKSDRNEQFEISSASCKVIFSYPCMVERKMVLKQECTTSCLVRQLMSSSQ